MYNKETFCDKDFAERSGGAICLKTLVLLGNDLVTPSNCPEKSLVLFMRFFGFVSRKISPTFSCIKFLQIRDVPTQISGHPGDSLSKTTEKGHLHKVSVRDIPTSGSLMSQEHPAQELYV